MQYFKLFANCIPVRGARVSIICDLQEHRYTYIPNELYDILESDFNEPISKLKKKYSSIFKTIEEYIIFFIEENWGFYTVDPDAFPNLSAHFESPFVISNSIIDVNKYSKHNFTSIFNQLSDLDCQSLELRFFDTLSLSKLSSILNYTYSLRFREIHLIVKYDNEITKKTLTSLLNQFLVLSGVVVHSAPKKNQFILDDGRQCVFTDERINSADCCGNISEKYFAINVATYTEALKFNTCLNKKISVDVNGEIKNCPSLKESFGSVNTNSLYSVVKKREFKRLWAVNKDKIQVCKDCQFRYICTDCRAFVENPLDKPLKCGYDPYTHSWKAD